MMLFLFLSIFISVCSTHWILIWFSLELNSIAYCSFLCLDLKRLKFGFNLIFLYYSIQLISSIFILFLSYSASFLNNVIIMFLIMMKLGVWPFYKWYLKMIYFTPMSFNSFFFLLSFQKIIPLMMLIHFFYDDLMVFIFILITLNMISSSLVLDYKLSSKMVMGVSSFNNNSWFLMGVLGGLEILFIYVFFYFSMLLVSLKGLLFTSNSYYNTGGYLFFIIVLLCNLGGVPPFSMFWMKILIFSFLFMLGFSKEIMFIMMMVACFFLYNYSWMVLSGIMLFFNKSQNVLYSNEYSSYIKFIILFSFLSFLFQLL